jgi:hypothetical protein
MIDFVWTIYLKDRVGVDDLLVFFRQDKPKERLILMYMYLVRLMSHILSQSNVAYYTSTSFTTITMFYVLRSVICHTLS